MLLRARLTVSFYWNLYRNEADNDSSFLRCFTLIPRQRKPRKHELARDHYPAEGRRSCLSGPGRFATKWRESGFSTTLHPWLPLQQQQQQQTRGRQSTVTTTKTWDLSTNLFHCSKPHPPIVFLWEPILIDYSPNLHCYFWIHCRVPQTRRVLANKD